MAVQYSSCTVLLTVLVAALKAKYVTELLAATDLTPTNHTECKDLNCRWRDLSCLLIAYCAAL